MSFEKEGATGLLMSDHGIKIGEITERNLDPDFAALLITTAASYRDNILQEDLFSSDDLDHISDDLDAHCKARDQLVEVLAFMKERDLSYVRFTP